MLENFLLSFLALESMLGSIRGDVFHSTKEILKRFLVQLFRMLQPLIFLFKKHLLKPLKLLMSTLPPDLTSKLRNFPRLHLQSRLRIPNSLWSRPTHLLETAQSTPMIFWTNKHVIVTQERKIHAGRILIASTGCCCSSVAQLCVRLVKNVVTSSFSIRNIQIWLSNQPLPKDLDSMPSRILRKEILSLSMLENSFPLTSSRSGLTTTMPTTKVLRRTVTTW